MTNFFEIYLSDPACVAGLEPVAAGWGGETVNLDSPRYRFGSLRVELLSRANDGDGLFLPKAQMPWRFFIPLETWAAWERGELSADDAGSLRGLFAALAGCSCWAVLLEYNGGEGARSESIATCDLFDTIDAIFVAIRERGEPGPGYLVFRPGRVGGFTR